MFNKNLMSLLQMSNFGAEGTISELQVLKTQEGQRGALVPAENVQTLPASFTLTSIGWCPQNKGKCPLPFSLGPSVTTLEPCGLWTWSIFPMGRAGWPSGASKISPSDNGCFLETAFTSATWTLVTSHLGSPTTPGLASASIRGLEAAPIHPHSPPHCHPHGTVSLGVSCNRQWSSNFFFR